MVEALQSKAIVEISEMVGAGEADLARIKDFISRQSDAAIRLAYRRNPEPMPRRCIMVGTADRKRFLPPDNNHRRFVPVVLGRGDARKVRRYMAKNRERLWSEAVSLYRRGVMAHLPERLKGRAEEAVGMAQWSKYGYGTHWHRSYIVLCAIVLCEVYVGDTWIYYGIRYPLPLTLSLFLLSLTGTHKKEKPHVRAHLKDYIGAYLGMLV